MPVLTTSSPARFDAAYHDTSGRRAASEEIWIQWACGAASRTASTSRRVPTMLGWSKASAVLPPIAPATCTTVSASATRSRRASLHDSDPATRTCRASSGGRGRRSASRTSSRRRAPGTDASSCRTISRPTKPVAPVTAMTGSRLMSSSIGLVQGPRVGSAVDQLARQDLGILEVVALEKVQPGAATREFARRSPRQRVQRDQLDQACDAELGLDFLLQPLDEPRLAERILLTALDDQNGDLGPVLRRNRECRSVLGANFGLLLGQVFEILRPDVAAVDDQQVLGTPGDEQRIAGAIADVAGIEPVAFAQRLARRFRIVGIAGHDARAAKEDGAALPFVE